jgi:predicted nucleotidyltransferase component of viral defense system
VEEIDGAVIETEEFDVQSGRENRSDEAGDEVRREERGDRRNVLEL